MAPPPSTQLPPGLPMILASALYSNEAPNLKFYLRSHKDLTQRKAWIPPYPYETGNWCQFCGLDRDALDMYAASYLGNVHDSEDCAKGRLK